MVKLKNPLISLGAVGRLGKGITFLRRRKQDLAEVTPVPKDAESAAQLSWRHMYQKCAALWHTLSAAEKRDWEALSGVRHMTGFAYWQSQCLRPNPGIYLPLQGGTMQGAIQMDDFHVHGLPLPIHVQDVWRRQDFQDFCLPFHMTQGARAYHFAAQAIPHNTNTILSFDSEFFDTDTIHDLVVNDNRLTCKTAGIYIIGASIQFAANAAGHRTVEIPFNGGVSIIKTTLDAATVPPTRLVVVTIKRFTVGQYAEVLVNQTSGAPLNVDWSPNSTPIFWMQRVGV